MLGYRLFEQCHQQMFFLGKEPRNGNDRDRLGLKRIAKFMKIELESERSTAVDNEIAETVDSILDDRLTKAGV